MQSKDRFIDRVLDHGMTVWLDLVATPTNQLGSFEEFGNTVTPEVARRVVRYISKKYHSQVDPRRKYLTTGCYNCSGSFGHPFPEHPGEGDCFQSQISQKDEK